MDSHSPPSKMARLTDSGNGAASCWRTKESNGCNGAFDSHPIGLKLELGLGGSSGRRVIGSAESYGFTILQLQELNLQSLIYKYIEAGFPVPHHLVVPIWKSVANSLGSIKCLYQLYPSFMTANQSFYMEWKNGGEPEPGRCRRTDGKKWRCSKEAVPDEKYCERHMHRGRQRSRKPVDSSGSACSTNLTIALPVNN